MTKPGEKPRMKELKELIEWGWIVKLTNSIVSFAKNRLTQIGYTDIIYILLQE